MEEGLFLSSLSETDRKYVYFHVPVRGQVLGINLV
nr:MAG TPA: hypothetical protein [Caudoviricetes sp.]